MRLSDTPTNILKVIGCTFGAVIAIPLVIVGAVAASLVATGIVAGRLVRRTRPRRAQAAATPVILEATIVPSEARLAYPLAAHGSAP